MNKYKNKYYMWYYWNIGKPLRHLRMLIEEKLGMTIVFRSHYCIVCSKGFENGYQCFDHMKKRHRLDVAVYNGKPSEAENWVYSIWHEWNINKHYLPKYMLCETYNK